MSISGIKHFKTVLVYLAVAALTILVDKVYAVFGHGVTSGYMTFMFLYPLLGGALFFLTTALLLPKAAGYPGYRLFYNLYNSGIALLTTASFMKGIFEVAGTDSSYVKLYDSAGFLSLTVGIMILVYVIIRERKKDKLADNN